MVSGATATSVTYTPTASEPELPDNKPILNAISVKDPTKSYADPFAVLASATTVTVTETAVSGTPTIDDANGVRMGNVGANSVAITVGMAARYFYGGGSGGGGGE